MALKCECGGEIRKTIDNKDECVICGKDESNTIKGDGTMTKEHDFKIEKISGTATVIDNGKTFTAYRGFAKASGYEEAVGHFTELKEGEKVRLLAKGEHNYTGYGTVYVIETYKGVRHLIGHRGIKIDEPAQIPEQTYAEIAEPFGKQFRDAIREAYARGYEDGKRIGEMMREESPQQVRDRIVEQAKRDSTEIERVMGYTAAFPYREFGCEFTKVDYVVNRNKRTVVALVRYKFINDDSVLARGIAKCMPDDCFNIHIGKAVALRKALGKSIDDYMNVPNPTEVRVGDVVTWELPNNTYVIEPGNRVINLQDGRDYTTYANLSIAKIIDDSRVDK